MTEAQGGTFELGPVPPARFQVVCADAADAVRLGTFWAAVLDQPLVDDRSDGVVRLEPGPGRPASAQVWFSPVPEPRTASRVQLAVRLAGPDPAPLVALGAVPVTDPGPAAPWWVLADPEGNLFRAVGPHPDVEGVDHVTPFELVVDSSDPLAQAQWWARVAGGEIGRDVDRGVAWIDGAHDFPHAYWVFTPAAEPKTVKNRWHWDVELTGAGPDPLVALGATLLRDRGGDVDWWVLADPEGNEFCALPGPA